MRHPPASRIDNIITSVKVLEDNYHRIHIGTKAPATYGVLRLPATATMVSIAIAPLNSGQAETGISVAPSIVMKLEYAEGRVKGKG